MISEDWPKTYSSQDFSKSAPNLDKNRQQHKQLFSSRNLLSHNSDEGIMNTIHTTTNTTTTPTSPNSQIKLEYDPKSSRIILITDNNNSNRNLKFHKKHSLDSSEYDPMNSQNSQSSDRTLKNNSSILYDRIFYRKVQQKIFSSTDYLDNTESSKMQQQKKHASKSSGDLTNDNDYYDNFKRKGSQFSRECFFTSNRNNSGDEDLIYRGDGDASLDKINSANSSFDEQSNSICSDASSVSRKSSVTFRQEHDVINSFSITKKGESNIDINQSIEKLYKCKKKKDIFTDDKKQKTTSTLSNFKKMFGKKKLTSKSATTLSTNSLVYREFRNIHDSSENLDTSKSRLNCKKI